MRDVYVIIVETDTDKFIYDVCDENYLEFTKIHLKIIYPDANIYHVACKFNRIPEL